MLPSLLRPICQACVNNQLLPTLQSPPRGREKKNVTKMYFSSCNDHSPKWIINDWYIFFPYLRVSIFLFLRTSFFTAQHVGPMLHISHPKSVIFSSGLFSMGCVIWLQLDWYNFYDDIHENTHLSCLLLLMSEMQQLWVSSTMTNVESIHNRTTPKETLDS